MRLLVVDCETSSVDPEHCDLLEVAAALYSVENATILRAFSWLVPHGKNEPDAEAVNHISPAMLAEAARLVSAPVEAARLADDADAIMAHNSSFDRAVLRRFEPSWDRRPWVDSKADLVFPHERGSKRLIHLAADHGVWMPGHHRALNDVLMLCSLLGCCHDLAGQVARALRPRVTAIALVSYDDREKAKRLGFTFDGAGRRWIKAVPEDEIEILEHAAAEAGFKVRLAA